MIKVKMLLLAISETKLYGLIKSYGYAFQKMSETKTLLSKGKLITVSFKGKAQV